MARLTFSILLFLFWNQVSGQGITDVSSSSFQYVLDELPSFIDLEASLKSGEWDFTKTAADRVIANKNVASGEIEIPFYGKSRIVNGQINELFISNILGTYINRYVKLKEPIQIYQITTGALSTGFSIVLGQDEIEYSQIIALPLVPDSIRIDNRITYASQEIGNVRMKYQNDYENGNIIKRNIKIEQTIDLKISPFDWEKLEDIEPETKMNEIHNFEQYIFQKTDLPQPLAIIQKEGDKLELAWLAAKGKQQKLRISGNPIIKAIPNPVINDVRFDLRNLEVGDYRIRLKNILGQTEMVETVSYTSPDSFLFNLENLRKGSYFYILEDQNGNVISTKRLIVIRP